MSNPKIASDGNSEVARAERSLRSKVERLETERSGVERSRAGKDGKGGRRQREGNAREGKIWEGRACIEANIGGKKRVWITGVERRVRKGRVYTDTCQKGLRCVTKKYRL